MARVGIIADPTVFQGMIVILSAYIYFCLSHCREGQSLPCGSLPCSIRLDGGIIWDFSGIFGQKNEFPASKSNTSRSIISWFWEINAPLGDNSDKYDTEYNHSSFTGTAALHTRSAFVSYREMVKRRRYLPFLRTLVR